MIIFLYGEDSYRIKEKTKEIVGQYKKTRNSGLALAYFDFSEKKEDVFSELKNKFSQTSLFSDEKKLLVVLNLFSNKFLKEKFLDYVKELSNSKDSIILLSETSKIRQDDKLLKLLKKEAKCQEFNLLEGLFLINWIKEEFGKLKAKIDKDALEKFFLFIGNDLWRANNEINKLAYFKKGGIINKEDVDLFLKPKLETDIFKTIELISRRDKKQALELLQRHLDNGDNPLYLLSMINFQFRNLLIIKELSDKNLPFPMIIQKSSLHPFVVRKSFSLAQKFSFEELKKIYKKIFDIDYNIKTGKIDPQAGLESLIVQI